jgi:predicted O-linked N-acetylglucosamine transferase (SPINDLY family)
MTTDETQSPLAEARTHHEAGRLEAAAEGYRRALERAPDDPAIQLQLGQVSHELGLLPQALAVLEAAVRSRPDDAATQHALGVVLFDVNRREAAADAFRQAVALDPARADSHHYLGRTLFRLGLREDGLAAFRDALAVDPEHQPAKWALGLSLPQVYRSPEEIEIARGQWAARLDELSDQLSLDTPPAIDSAVEAMSSVTNFYLHYQGRDDLDLQRRFGALLHRVAAARFPALAEHPPARPAPGRRLRVGFVSAHFRFHSVMKTHGRWVTDLDRERFEVHLFHTSGIVDSTTEAVCRTADSYFRTTRPDVMVEAIAARRLDALVYLDIGMDPRTYVPAALRLAPVQCNTWGHPVTSGLPTLDYYLSSDLMEPADGAAHYSETLARLPNLSISYPRPPPAEAEPRAVGKPVYLCSQSLFKLLPQFDFVYPRIAAQAGACEFWFLEGVMKPLAATFRERLRHAFADYGLDAERYCRILPPAPYADFLALTRRADVFLDSFLWSGCNSALEAVACGLPIVTWPGPMMRGRHCRAILARLGVSETIASDPEDYCRIAARLGREPEFRRAVVAAMATGLDRVFNDAVPIQALGDFLETQCRNAPR